MEDKVVTLKGLNELKDFLSMLDAKKMESEQIFFNVKFNKENPSNGTHSFSGTFNKFNELVNQEEKHQKSKGYILVRDYTLTMSKIPHNATEVRFNTLNDMEIYLKTLPNAFPEFINHDLLMFSWSFASFGKPIADPLPYHKFLEQFKDTQKSLPTDMVHKIVLWMVRKEDVRINVLTDTLEVTHNCTTYTFADIYKLKEFIDVIGKNQTINSSYELCWYNNETNLVNAGIREYQNLHGLVVKMIKDCHVCLNGRTYYSRDIKECSLRVYTPK